MLKAHLAQKELGGPKHAILIFLRYVFRSVGAGRKYGSATGLLVTLYIFLRAWKKWRGTESLWPNWPAQKYNEEAQKKIDVWSMEPYGAGFPQFTVDWRRYLYPGKTARENVLTLLGTSKRKQFPLKKLVVNDVVDLMQFSLRLRFTEHVHAGTFFSREQLRLLAKKLLKDAHIPVVDKESKKKNRCYDVVEYPTGQPIPNIIVSGLVGGACILRPAARLLGLQSKTVTVLSHPDRSSRLHYYERPGAGETIVLLHGLLVTAASWFPLIPYLEGRRIIALDLSDFAFGFSRSTPAVSGIIDHTQVVEAFLRAPGIAGPGGMTIIGHSFGGTIAWHIGRRLSCPGINRIVMMSPMCGQFAYTWAHCPIAVVAHKNYPGMPEWMDYQAQKMRARLFHGPDCMNSGLASLFNDDHMTGFRSDGFPHKIKVPTLLLFGTDDGDIPPRAPKFLLESFSLHCPHPLSQAFFLPAMGNKHGMFPCPPLTSLNQMRHANVLSSQRILDFMRVPPFVLRQNIPPVCVARKKRARMMGKLGNKKRRASVVRGGEVDLSNNDGCISLELMARARPSCARAPMRGDAKNEDNNAERKRNANQDVAGPRYDDLALPEGRLELTNEDPHACGLVSEWEVPRLAGSRGKREEESCYRRSSLGSLEQWVTEYIERLTGYPPSMLHTWPHDDDDDV